MSKEKSKIGYISMAFLAVCTILIVKKWFPGAIPLKTFACWSSKGSIIDWLQVGLPLLVWGFVAQGFLEIRKIFRKRDAILTLFERLFGLIETPGTVMKKGFFISLRAGIVEELAFRWLIFLGAIVWVQIGNFLIFGWLGFGVGQWLHVNVLGPIANWITFGYLTSYIFHPSGWFVGAALLYSNAFFRDGHKYQGLFGWIDSWFAGLYFFWLCCTFGIVSAMVVHFTYDLMIFTVVAIGMMLQRSALGRRGPLPYEM